MILVLDASVSIAITLRAPEAADLESRLSPWTSVQAPRHWRAEVANGLLMAVRRKRIELGTAEEALQEMIASPVHLATDADVNVLFQLGQQHGLTIYDAAYLELALRLRATLATLDVELAAAAASAGVERLL